MTVQHGFELLKEETILEINTQARLFRHKKTGAELLSLENDDENKVFGITFRTPPEDSTGLPHIMEHAVLCGSKKYPVKEPFVELLKGSLKTFLNAFTFPDKTCYPVASTNQQDFYNLVDVYLDAVFHPLIPPETLQQEGWHYELESLDDPLTFKGVVFNEMKGAYSSSDALLSRYAQQSLFPDNTYGVDSGGDPQVIPDLTYEQFKSFHETYYHPGNSRIFFYGDDPIDERLSMLEGYLQAFEETALDSSIPLQAAFSDPKRFVYGYDASDDPDETNTNKFSINWLLPEVTDAETVLGLQILSYILTGTSASPLRKTLIDSGLGEDLTGGGLGGHLRQLTYAVGLKGVAADNVDTAETLILNTLSDLAQNGIEQDMIEAAMNTVEFRLRENNTGSFPRGLSLMLSALTTWLHNDDPVEALRYEVPLQSVKDKLASGDTYFETLIQTYLINNAHRTMVILEPDVGLRQQQEAEEVARLAAVRDSLDEEALQQIIENTRHLKELQTRPDPPEALATLPRLELSDLEKHNKSIPIEVSTDAGSEILYHDLFTNGIVYLDVGFNMHVLPQDLLPYASLFSMMLLDVGTENEDFVQLTQRIGRKTGGLWTSELSSSVQNQDEGVSWFFLRGKGTMSQVDDLLDIIRDVLLTVQLDNPERFRQLILEDKAGQESGLIPGGHSVVNGRLRAKFNEIDWADEQMDGLDYLFFIRDLVDRIDTDWPDILEK
ncbi:MAG: insulinase family protein, partial [Chloroflexota bacterium]